MWSAPFESMAISENSPTLVELHDRMFAQTPDSLDTNGFVKSNSWENGSPTSSSNKFWEVESDVKRQD